MQLYTDSKQYKLYLGSMLDLNQVILPNTIDSIVTDPPYDVAIFHEGSGSSVNNICKLDKTLIPINDITKTNYDLLKFCENITRVMKKINIYIWCNKSQIIDYFNYFVNKLGCLYDILIWNKNNALPTYANKYLTDCEYCLYFHEPGLCFPKSYEDAKTVYYSSINRENQTYKHPNIKPRQFVKSHISNSCESNATVLDPFMGSGTVEVVCKQLNINCIGIEINKTYFDNAKRRINGDIQNIGKSKQKSKLI